MDINELTDLTEPHYSQLEKLGALRDNEVIDDKQLQSAQKPITSAVNMIVTLRLRQETYRALWEFEDTLKLDKWAHKDKLKAMKKARKVACRALRSANRLKRADYRNAKKQIKIEKRNSKQKQSKFLKTHVKMLKKKPPYVPTKTQ